MRGTSNLQDLLANMNPILVEGDYVFCTVSQSYFQQLDISPLGTFLEREGMTLILKKQEADASKLDYRGTWKLITLSVHSDLEAVGFLAVITGKLAEAGISVNVVSAYFHDHLFVPFSRFEEVLEVLRSISSFS